MGPLQRTPGAAPTAFSQDPPWLRRREQTSLMKNRMREICTSGSARDGDGNVPIYSATPTVVISEPTAENRADDRADHDGHAPIRHGLALAFLRIDVEQ